MPADRELGAEPAKQPGEGHRESRIPGREEAEALLQRRSGNPDKPRILGAFNEPTEDWLSFFMFTTFTDRDGKYQLLSLAESAFDPLARTTRFMLTEEAHHMFVGQMGVARVAQRAAELTREGKDPREHGAIPFDMLQRYLSFWYAVSLDLFGSEVSTNAAGYFGGGLKGRPKEERFADHVLLDGSARVELLEDGRVVEKDVAPRLAVNLEVRNAYAEDCQAAVDKWNRLVAGLGVTFLPAMAVEAGLAGAAPIAVRRIDAEHPSREIVVAWRSGSNRGVEGKLLADTLRNA